MLKKFALFMALLPVMAMGQSKVAVVDMKGVFDAMPEKAAAEQQLSDLSARYQAEYDMLKTEFSKKYADYQAIAGDATTPATIRDRRIQEIQENDRKISEFEQNTRNDINQQREQLLAPLKAKLQAAIKTVADANGITVVLDKGQGVVYASPEAIDITGQVKQRLGIE